MKTFLTKEQATYIADKFEIKPKSTVIFGSYYDYQFKCGLYYTNELLRCKHTEFLVSTIEYQKKVINDQNLKTQSPQA